jgi:hypothetical protein
MSLATFIKKILKISDTSFGSFAIFRLTLISAYHMDKEEWVSPKLYEYPWFLHMDMDEWVSRNPYNYPRFLHMEKGEWLSPNLYD